MLSQISKMLLSIFLNLASISVFAEEHGAAPAPPAEGHGAAPEEKKVAPPEWLALQNDLNTLKAKVKSKQDAIMKILEEKKHGGAKASAGGGHGGSAAPASAPEAQGSRSEALATEYKELQQLSEEYEKKRTVLMFRYPEKGKDPDRRYNRLQIKSLEEMEAQTGVDAQLDLNMEIMKKQFPNRKAVKVVEPPKKKEKVLKENTIESETIILSK